MRSLRGVAGWMSSARAEPPLIALLIVALECEAWLGAGAARFSRLATALAAVGFAAPLAFRRRWPAVALVGSAAAAAVAELLRGGLLDYPRLSVLVIVVLGYGAGASLTLRRSVAALGLADALLVVGVPLAAHVSHVPGDRHLLTNGALLTIALAGPWLVGRLMRERRRRTAAFAELAARATAERGERERAAIAEERVRIGREAQDVIAHSIGAMLAQAAGARAQLRHEPDRARAAIMTVERTGREALGDMRRLLGLLRRDEDPRALSPQPGLDQLATLAAALGAQGLAVELRPEGEPVDLTPGVSLVGYRVVEAALASAAHQRVPRATVAVRYGRRLLELEVSADRPAGELAGALRGVSERVALYGGTLDLLTTASGFAVRCRLSLDVAPVR